VKYHQRFEPEFVGTQLEVSIVGHPNAYFHPASSELAAIKQRQVFWPDEGAAAELY
jgi:hypothetical protein